MFSNSKFDKICFLWQKGNIKENKRLDFFDQKKYMVNSGYCSSPPTAVVSLVTQGRHLSSYCITSPGL